MDPNNIVTPPSVDSQIAVSQNPLPVPSPSPTKSTPYLILGILLGVFLLFLIGLTIVLIGKKNTVKQQATVTAGLLSPTQPATSPTASVVSPSEASTNGVLQVPAGWKSYTSPTKVTFSYPAEWDGIPSDNKILLMTKQSQQIPGTSNMTNSLIAELLGDSYDKQSQAIQVYVKSSTQKQNLTINGLNWIYYHGLVEGNLIEDAYLLSHNGDVIIFFYTPSDIVTIDIVKKIISSVKIGS